jgi:hypothetical protein
MTRFRIGALTALATAALAAFAATVIGGESAEGPGNAPAAGAESLRAMPVSGPGYEKGGWGGRISYFETDPVDDIPPGPGGRIVGRCPNGTVVINGYYFQEDEIGNGVFVGFGLDDQGSSPVGYANPDVRKPPRKWAFYWDNVAQAQGGGPTDIDGVTFGLICERD